MIGPDGEVRPLEDEDFKGFIRGRPPMLPEDRKQRVNLTLDADVVKALKERGRMSTEANAILRAELGI
jgi:uncharacterized protein (DUF4415 family)